MRRTRTLALPNTAGGAGLSPKPGSDSSNSTINVYRLSDPTPLILDSTRISKALLPPDVRLDDQHIFYISNASGWMGYTDRSKMWQPVPSAAVPQDSGTALAAAKEYISDVATRIRADKQLTQLGITPPSLDGLTPEIVSVANPNVRAAGIDHWLCRFQATLDSGASGKIPIVGALIEVRIGGRSTGVGFPWRWRFVNQKPLATPLLPPAAADNSSSDSAYGNAPPNLVYLFADQGVRQGFLAPYYMSSLSDDSPQVYPASGYSLLAELSQAPVDEGVQVTCQASGGSGNYIFDWCSWSPLEDLDNDLTPPQDDDGQQGGSSSITLPFGIYNIIVNVTDTQTEASFQIQRSCYFGAAASADQQDPASLVS